MESSADLGLWSHRSDGVTVVAAFTQLRHQWNLSEQRNIKFLCQLCSTARTKEFITLAVVAGKP